MAHTTPQLAHCAVFCVAVVAFLTKRRTDITHSHTHLVGRQEAEVEGRVGDHVPLGALSGAQDHIVPQSE